MKDEKKTVNKKYYWLKLKEDFFDDKVIKYLRKLPDGNTLVVIYLKMQLKSLKTEGFIQYDQLLPTYEEELALVLDEDINSVRFAIGALLKLGVVELWENDTLYMASMQQLIGSETAAAERVRRHRALKKNGLIESLDVKQIAPKTNAERQKNYRAKQYCKKNGHVPFIDDYTNNQRYGGNYYIVFRRDKCKCVTCNSNENLCIHHIDGYENDAPQNNKENKLITVCRTCHSNIHEGNIDITPFLEGIGYFDDSNESVTSNVTSNSAATTCNTEIEIEKDIDLDIEKDIERDNKQETRKKRALRSYMDEQLFQSFLQLWNMYPCKQDRKKAYQAYKRAIQQGTTDDEIRKGMEKYIEYVHYRQKTDFPELKFKNGSTFFSQRSWESEYEIPTQNTHTQNTHTQNKVPSGLTERDMRNLDEYVSEVIKNATTGQRRDYNAIYEGIMRIKSYTPIFSDKYLEELYESYTAL